MTAALLSPNRKSAAAGSLRQRSRRLIEFPGRRGEAPSAQGASKENGASAEESFCEKLLPHLSGPEVAVIAARVSVVGMVAGARFELTTFRL